MADEKKLCSAEETSACCCVDVGTIIDNESCTSSFERVFASKADAEQMMATLTAKANAAASEPCKIHSEYKETADGVELKADFTFSCQAETLIFELGLR
ncbi:MULTISPECIES: YfcZ/YiiS family protein [Morganella]|uniref:YfcZ/YiiS family protein n=1 Tax=Morganella morganii TaxID=582 RepID=A0A9Q4CRY7_MORMO|nr:MULTISPECIES: YfcZ/YiiS family protein [Morganella]BEP20825.1 YfcZ/YiiS family protein [Morganella morganii subsp. sibonii]HAE77045.1 DUF406 family protein [Morganella sp. (in: enterobacteria)]HDS6844267.1 YfcZ/YiiS family protein [Morganella morganii subsp. morganii]EGT3622307.1 DUF406 family protein [Morganella morganii]EGT3628931.1 DUF406 family protein [Morganella morganii]